VVDLSELKGLADWPRMRRDIEAAVATVLGKTPREELDLQIKTVDETDFPGFVRKRINYFVDQWSRVAAWLFIPDSKEEHPAIVCCHQMTPRGKDEPAGLNGLALLAHAQRYAERGYVTIAPDCITAGDRVSSGLEPFDTKTFYKESPKISILGRMLADHMRAVDVLSESRHVDGARIGVIGHDLGARNALFLTAFDERVQTCVASCGFTLFDEDADPGRWARPSGFVQLPKLKEAIEKKSYPFEWDQVLAMLAPSPTLLITSLNDEVLSNTKSCDKAVTRAKKVYKLLGAEHAIENFNHRAGHTITPEAMEAADEWFERWI